MYHKVFDKGHRVMTPHGAGSVNYSRMGPPTYSTPEAYSVFLDRKIEEQSKPPFPSYSGTMVSASDVRDEKEVKCGMVKDWILQNMVKCNYDSPFDLAVDCATALDLCEMCEINGDRTFIPGYIVEIAESFMPSRGLVG